MTEKKLIKLIDIEAIASANPQDGLLVVAENMRNIPFEIKRVYCIISSNKKLVRGHHAHKELKQVMICLSGSCKVTLDDGNLKEEVVLNSPSKGLLLAEKPLWRTISEFSDNCVIMVLANQLYDENDYIRSYDEFLNFVK